jgi:Concanavalin A-like lectin/glucanases superfamily
VSYSNTPTPSFPGTFRAPFPHPRKVGGVSLPPPLALTDYPTEVMSDSPVGYWRLGDPVGGTTAFESSGRGPNGVYTGGYTLGATGALSGDSDTAVTLNGSTGYVALPPSEALNLGGSPITMECWVKTTSTDAHDNLISGYEPEGAFAGYGFRLNNGLLGYYSSADGSWRQATTGGVNDGDWHHVAVTVSGTTVTFYIDGVTAGSPTSAQPGSWAGIRAIGARSNGGEEWLAGDIDEVAIYPTALSGARILAHYEAGVGGAGTQFITPAGTLTLSGALAKRVQLPDAGTLTSAGADLQRPLLPDTGTLTPAGANALRVQLPDAGTLVPAGADLQRPLLPDAGTLTTAGADLQQPQLPDGGTVTPSGALSTTKVVLYATAGTLTTAGALAQQIAKSLAGTLGLAGALLQSSAKSLAGTLTASGASVQRSATAQAGTLTPTGALDTTKVSLLATAGTLSLAGGVSKIVATPDAGTLTTAGGLATEIDYGTFTITPAGTLTTSGALAKLDQKALTGTATTAGALVKQDQKAQSGTVGTAGALLTEEFGLDLILGGTLTTAGAAIRRVGKLLAGLLSLAGSLVKQRTFPGFAGTVGLSGADAEQPRFRYAGTLTTAGAPVLKRDSKRFTGTLSLSGAVVPSITLGAVRITMGGTLGSSGAIARSPRLVARGTVVSIGRFSRDVRRSSAGTLAPTGTWRRFQGTLTRAGTLSSSGATGVLYSKGAALDGELDTSGASGMVRFRRRIPKPPEFQPVTEGPVVPP